MIPNEPHSHDDDDQELLAAVKRLPELPTPDGMRDRFHARLEGTRLRHRTVPGWLQVAIAAALVITSAVLLWPGRTNPAGGPDLVATAILAPPTDSIAPDVPVAATGRTPLSGTPASRLRAVVRLVATSDTEASILALSDAAMHDLSTNVRVASIAALGQVASPGKQEEVYASIAQSDDSPFVHAQLLSVVVTLPAPARAHIERLLLARSDLDPTIRGALAPQSGL